MEIYCRVDFYASNASDFRHIRSGSIFQLAGSAGHFHSSASRKFSGMRSALQTVSERGCQTKRLWRWIRRDPDATAGTSGPMSPKGTVNTRIVSARRNCYLCRDRTGIFKSRVSGSIPTRAYASKCRKETFHCLSFQCAATCLVLF